MPAAFSRVALVTGSGKKRVGWYIADALAGQGYALAVHYCASAVEAKETVEHLRSRGTEADAFQADLTNGEAARKLIQGVGDRFGRLDVLVNCAAVWKAKRLEDITAADLLHNFSVNVLGTFICAQEAGLVMVKQAEGGCIINFGDWALARPYLDYAAYFSTKGAIPALTRCLAVELGTATRACVSIAFIPARSSSNRTFPTPSVGKPSRPRWHSGRADRRTSPRPCCS